MVLVLELQKLLRNQHYIVGPLDGLPGKRTAAAIKRYERDNGRPSTGVRSKELLRELQEKPPKPMEIPPHLAGLKAAVWVDLDRPALVLFVMGKYHGIYSVSIGKLSTPSPFGLWTIVNKALNPGGSFGARWMGIDAPWGSYGVHGTNNPNVIGGQVSNGCIRMYNTDVIEIYEYLYVGSKVLMTGNPYGLAIFRRELKTGHMGSDVYLVQERLLSKGFLDRKPDGIFGQRAEKALKDYQQSRGLPPHGRFDRATKRAMFGE